MSHNHSPKNDDSENEDSQPVHWFRKLRLLYSLNNELVAQFKLHCLLIKVEWHEEKRRLWQMLVTTFLGFAFFLCFLISFGALVLIVAWNTSYLVASAIALCATYGLVSYLLWNYFMTELTRPEGLFANTRAEFLKDIDVILRKIR